MSAEFASRRPVGTTKSESVIGGSDSDTPPSAERPGRVAVPPISRGGGGVVVGEVRNVDAVNGANRPALR